MADAGAPKLCDFELRVDVKREVESVRPDAVVTQDLVVLDHTQEALVVCNGKAS